MQRQRLPVSVACRVPSAGITRFRFQGSLAVARSQPRLQRPPRFRRVYPIRSHLSNSTGGCSKNRGGRESKGAHTGALLHRSVGADPRVCPSLQREFSNTQRHEFFQGVWADQRVCLSKGFLPPKKREFSNTLRFAGIGTIQSNLNPVERRRCLPCRAFGTVRGFA